MKKSLILITLSITLFACQNGNNDLEKAKALYKIAQENLDASTTKVALNQLILLDSTNLDYKDSLSRLYMATGNYQAGSKLGNEVYKSGKADNELKESLALSYQQLNKLDKAERMIDELWKSTKNYKYQYQKLVLSYNKRDMIGFDTLATSLLGTIEADSMVAKTTVALRGPVTGANQDVPLLAAVYFIIGNNAFDNEQNVQKSVAYFTKSIEVYNEFELARYSLQEIERMIAASRM
jgi:tetratricopeptide (TPR) repeat protein